MQPHPFPPAPVRTDFTGPGLPMDFQWLRSPFPEGLFTLAERPGFLRLHGRESIGSSFRQALVARRQQSHCYSARTYMEYDPRHYQQSAGLVCYYGANKFHYLYVAHDETLGRHLRAMSALPNAMAADSFTAPVALPPGSVHLQVEVDEERLRFAYSLDGAARTVLPELLDASILSDEAAVPGTPSFTGAFVGLCCQDTAGTRLPADFLWFDHEERPHRAGPGQEQV